MSTAQPPHREEDSPQAPHAAGQQAGLARSRDRVPGEKKAWAKKARRRHSVAPTKFPRHEDDKLPGRSSSFVGEIAEEVDEEAVEDSTEEAVEEAAEEVIEEIADEPVDRQKDDKLPGRSTSFVGEIAEDSEDPVDELVDEQTAEDLAEEKGDKLPGRSTSTEPEEPANEQPEEIAEELEFIEEQPDQADGEQPEELAEEQLEQADETPFIDSDEDPVEEEIIEEIGKDFAEGPVEDSAEEIVEEVEEEVAEDLAEEEVTEGVTEEIADEVVDEETAEEAEDLGEYVDELSRELDVLDERKGDKLPGRSSSDELEEPENEQPEEIVEEFEVIEEQPEKLAEEQLEQADETPFVDSDEEPIEEEIVEEFEVKRERISHKGDKLPGRSTSFERPKPTKRIKPTPTPAPEPVERPKPTKCEKPAPESAPEPVERPKPTKREKPKPAPESTSKPAPAPTPATAEHPKPTKRKKPAPRYRYIKSPSLEQAFRNLLRLDAGAAWRATRIPLVAFFLCFALLALAIADQAPAIDSFNATINALVHGTRGMLDGFFVTITTLGDLLPMTALCLIVCAILAIARKWDSLAFFATNVILAVVCVQALKFIFAVPRPGAETLVPIPGSFSFPSAHSFCSLIVFGMIGLLIFRAMNRKGVPYNAAIVPGIILVIFAILIGISRIYVGVHWPSDVLGGWLLAGMWLPFASALYTVGSRKR